MFREASHLEGLHNHDWQFLWGVSRMSSTILKGVDEWRSNCLCMMLYPSKPILQISTSSAMHRKFSSQSFALLLSINLDTIQICSRTYKLIYKLSPRDSQDVFCYDLFPLVYWTWWIFLTIWRLNMMQVTPNLHKNIIMEHTTAALKLVPGFQVKAHFSEEAFHSSSDC